jgi:hypothetical protein
MDVEILEQICKIMHKYKVNDLKMANNHIRIEDFTAGDLDEEAKKKLEKLKNASKVSDEDILFNPYAGLDENE